MSHVSDAYSHTNEKIVFDNNRNSISFTRVSWWCHPSSVRHVHFSIGRCYVNMCLNVSVYLLSKTEFHLDATLSHVDVLMGMLQITIIHNTTILCANTQTHILLHSCSMFLSLSLAPKSNRFGVCLTQSPHILSSSVNHKIHVALSTQFFKFSHTVWATLNPFFSLSLSLSVTASVYLKFSPQ